MTEYNSQALGVWLSTHLDNGELRPELHGLPQDEFIKSFVAHAPDPPQSSRLTSLLYWAPTWPAER